MAVSKLYTYQNRNHLERSILKNSRFHIPEHAMDCIELLYMSAQNNDDLAVIFRKMTYLLRFAESTEDIDQLKSILKMIAKKDSDGYEYDLSILDFMDKYKPYMYKYNSETVNGELSVDLIDMDDISGVYLLFDGDKQIIYIGKSKSIKGRVISHVGSKNPIYFRYIKTNTLSDMHLLEIYLIGKFKPPKNIESNTDDSLTFNIEFEYSTSNFIKIYKDVV